MREPLDLEERLANLISHGITPRLLPELEILCRLRSHVLAVQVFPSSTRPHQLTKEEQVNGVYVGVGFLTSEIAKAIGLTPRATRTPLARLVGLALVREIGTGPQDPRRRYYRAA